VLAIEFPTVKTEPLDKAKVDPELKHIQAMYKVKQAKQINVVLAGLN